MVLGINGAMFFLELAAGLWAGSVALQADSLDMLGDALVYGFSLAVVGGSLLARVRAAQLKGVIMLLFGVLVLIQIGLKIVHGLPPDPFVVSGMGVAALAANLACVGLLYQFRSDDINMRSTWVCSRNDIVANLGVIVSAGAVALFSSIWPDLVVSLGIVALFLWSARGVLQEASTQISQASRPAEMDLCAKGLCPASACRCT